MPSNNTTTYEPRRSNRVSSNIAPSDGTVWKEKLVVCEGVQLDGNPKLIIRSYFRNEQTGQKAWDEPPSGAAQVVHATPAMHQQAEAQLTELQVALDTIPTEGDLPGEEPPNSTKPKKKGFFGRMMRGSKKQVPLSADRDLGLQRAIARSMADQQFETTSSDEPVVFFDVDGRQEDDDLAMAKALSMSVEAPMSEEEQLQRALEASRLDAGVASAPGPQDVEHHDATVGELLWAEDMDQKPAAVKTDDLIGHSQHSASEAFDPYAPGRPEPVREASFNPPTKLESDEDHRKTGRGIARRVFGGRKTMEKKAGVV